MRSMVEGAFAATTARPLVALRAPPPPPSTRRWRSDQAAVYARGATPFAV